MLSAQPVEPTLLFSRQSLAGRIPADGLVAAVEAAFLRLAAGTIATPPVGHVPGTDGAFHLKTAVGSEPPSRAVVKLNGNFPGNPSRFGLPTVQGLVALLDAERGSLLALMDSMEITALRTAAATAVAARRLARPDADSVAFVGCGVQAHAHLSLLARHFRLARASCHDPRADALARFAEAARGLGLEVRLADSPAEACRDAALVVTSTPSRRPVLDAGDVPDGCFVAAVGADNPDKHEIAPALMARARVVPDVLAQAIEMGDLRHALAAGAMTLEQVHGDLASVVAGLVPGRQSAGELFVFDSTGTAATDLAAAELVYTSLRGCADVPRLDFGA